MALRLPLLPRFEKREWKTQRGYIHSVVADRKDRVVYLTQWTCSEYVIPANYLWGGIWQADLRTFAKQTRGVQFQRLSLQDSERKNVHVYAINLNAK